MYRGNCPPGAGAGPLGAVRAAVALGFTGAAATGDAWYADWETCGRSAWAQRRDRAADDRGRRRGTQRSLPRAFEWPDFSRDWPVKR